MIITLLKNSSFKDGNNFFQNIILMKKTDDVQSDIINSLTMQLISMHVVTYCPKKPKTILRGVE